MGRQIRRLSYAASVVGLHLYGLNSPEYFESVHEALASGLAIEQFGIGFFVYLDVTAR